MFPKEWLVFCQLAKESKGVKNFQLYKMTKSIKEQI